MVLSLAKKAAACERNAVPIGDLLLFQLELLLFANLTRDRRLSS